MSCTRKPAEEISVKWDNDKAVSLSIPTGIVGTIPDDSLKTLLVVSLDIPRKVAIFGDAFVKQDQVVFTPVVPFARGLTYEIFARDKAVGKITIPGVDGSNPPAITGIYPSADTLPENLLKFYIVFSQPMREGESLHHIGLYNKANEKVENVFLDIRPELWNAERTALTIWLDPGRIKRELIPNKEMGNPLINGEKYVLKVSSKWRDVRGLMLKDSVSKSFVVFSRDSVSPSPGDWKLDVPLAGTSDPFMINAFESLDYFLLKKTLAILDETNSSVVGSWTINEDASSAMFRPSKPWVRGAYRLRVGSHLEDLAGNNLNRPFDRNITLGQSRKDVTYVYRAFNVQ